MPEDRRLRARQKLGKYRIEGRVTSGPRAAVYRAYDTIQGLRVALKIPHASMVNEEFLKEFRQEVRLASQLEHPNVLPIQNACFIDGLFVIAMPLGDETLAERQQRRMSTDLALDFTRQAVAAVAHAHSRRIIHCDIKPENFILFADHRLRLADFGFSKLGLGTIKASGSGTIGYLAPEQALGRPMFQSDVFSLGLVIYEVFSGILPEWPYDWPPPGYPRIRKKLSPKALAWLRKAMEVRPQERFRDAVAMERALAKMRPRRIRRGH